MLMLGIFIFGGCNLYGGNSNTTTLNLQTSTQKTSVATNTINIQNFAFEPSVLTIEKGATVTWMNSDSAPHQIKSTNFNSNQLSKGQTFSFAFNDAGTFDYFCSIHPSMVGKIIVQ